MKHSSKTNPGIKVHHARATSYTITRLRANTPYEVFIIPFYKSVMGMPSSSVGVTTLEDLPRTSPAIHNVTLVNDDLLIYWLPLDPRDANGVVDGYNIKVSGDDNKEVANVMASPANSHYGINIPDINMHQSVSIKIAAVNKAGSGPFSAPIIIDTNIHMNDDSLININSNLTTNNDSTSVWVGALFGSLILFLLCIGIVILMRKRQVIFQTRLLSLISKI